MKPCFCTLIVLILGTVPVQAHFIWIVPGGVETTKLKVVFSENLEPDESVSIEKIAGTKLFSSNEMGQMAALDWKKGKGCFVVTVPDQTAVVGGVCTYGVLEREKGKPFLLAYYPKFVRCDTQAAKTSHKLLLEIVTQGEGRFQVLFGGKLLAETEVVVLMSPTEGTETLKSNAKGEIKTRSAGAGQYVLRARHLEKKAGEHDGKKYQEIRHYATLVVQVPPGKERKPEASITSHFAPLPRAVSSFGAAVADGWLYVYGGHCAKTHRYSTESVAGTFHRLKLSDPTTWEELPSGPGLQGLALVAHQGKLYRIGGMQPRNRPGDKADNHSVVTCARFDPRTKKWKSLPDLPEGRSSHDAVVVGDKIVVVGGWTMLGAEKEANWLATALVMDLNQEHLKWQLIKQPFRRRALTAAVYEGKVYVLGGMADDLEIKLTVNIYDPTTDGWTTGPDLPGGERNGFAAAAIAMGGRLYLSPANGGVFQLNKEGAGWQDVGRLKKPRIVHRLVAAGDHSLLAVGGAAQGENLDLLEAITP